MSSFGLSFLFFIMENIDISEANQILRHSKSLIFPPVEITTIIDVFWLRILNNPESFQCDFVYVQINIVWVKVTEQNFFFFWGYYLYCGNHFAIQIVSYDFYHWLYEGMKAIHIQWKPYFKFWIQFFPRLVICV